MGKIFGIVLIVACVWVGLEIYNKGMHGAFGGALASFSNAPPEQHEAPLAKRLENRGNEIRDRQLDRIESQLGDPSVGLQDPN